MSTLDEIVAGADTIMTPNLRRLFLAAGCNPGCHACAKTIKDGAVFRLVTHVRGGTSSDEMCCARCGSAALARRDRRDARSRACRGDSVRNSVGYTRPSVVFDVPVQGSQA